MSSHTRVHPNYPMVWLGLMGLAIVSALASRMGLPATLTGVIVYGAAAAKAILVALYFMHLRSQRLLILGLILIPLFLFFILFVTLLPDFVYTSA